MATDIICIKYISCFMPHNKRFSQEIIEKTNFSQEISIFQY